MAVWQDISVSVFFILHSLHTVLISNSVKHDLLLSYIREHLGPAWVRIEL